LVIGTQELLEIFAASAAMVIEFAPAYKSVKDLRGGAQEFRKLVARMAKDMRERRQETGLGIMEMMGAELPASTVINRRVDISA
jgi:hypothetical protein